MLGRAVRRVLSRMLETRADRDGQAAALEPSAIPSSWGQSEAPPDRAVRHRLPGMPQDILIRSLSQKVLYEWLRNQHQILVPHKMDVGRLSPPQIQVLMDFAAVALLSGSTPDDAGHDSVVRWLQRIKATAGAIDAFDAALDDPRPLSILVQQVREHDLGPYAYAAAVVASDQQEIAGRLFANYVAARLALPAEAVRSIDRQHRR